MKTCTDPRQRLKDCPLKTAYICESFNGKAMTTGEGGGRAEEVHLLRRVIRVRRVAVEEGGW
jgi:hypothetical protein